MDLYNNILFLLIIISIIILTGIQQKLYEGLEDTIKFDRKKHRDTVRNLNKITNDDDFYEVDYSKCKDEHEQYIETTKKYKEEKINFNKMKQRLTTLKVKLTTAMKGRKSGRRNIRAHKLEQKIIEKEVQMGMSRELITKLEVELLRISTLTESPYCFKLSILKDSTNVISEEEEAGAPRAPGCYVYSDQPCRKKGRSGYLNPGMWQKLNGKYSEDVCYGKNKRWNRKCKSNDFKVHFNP